MEYQKDTTDENRQIYKQTKQNLEEAYNVFIEEDLDSKLKDVEKAHANSKHGQSWRLNNYITGRKASPKGQLKGDTQKDRVINWFNHFKNLLGSPPDIDDEDKEILPILESLNIKTGPFDLKDYKGNKVTSRREELWGRWHTTRGFKKM